MGALRGAASGRGDRPAVGEVPRLVEAGAEERCNAVAGVVAPAFLQAQRVLRRRGMTPARLAAIRDRQMPDREKLRRADFVIHTGLGRRSSLRELRRMVSILTSDPEQEAEPGHA